MFAKAGWLHGIRERQESLSPRLRTFGLDLFQNRENTKQALALIIIFIIVALVAFALVALVKTSYHEATHSTEEPSTTTGTKAARPAVEGSSTTTSVQASRPATDPSDSFGRPDSKWVIGDQFERMKAGPYGPTAMVGIMDNWTIPKLVYSDSQRDIYVEANAIEIEMIPMGALPRIGDPGWANLLAYVQKGGPFVASVIIDYKDRAILDRIARLLKGAPHPELLRYRTEQVILDVPNNEMSFAAIGFADRDGEAVASNGLLHNAWTNKTVIPLSSSPCFMEVAKRIAAIMEQAKDDPKIGDRIRYLSAFTLRKSPSRPGYTTYSNLKFGYRIDYPQEFVSKKSSSPYEAELISPDRKAILLLHSGNTEGNSLKDYYTGTKGQATKDGGVLSEVLKDKWFVMTWRSEGYIVCTKQYVGRGSINAFEFMYPEGEKDKYERVLANMQESFIPGDTDRAW